MNAYILCGGESRRMGEPKALLSFRGMPMAEHIAEIAREAGFSPFFIVKSSQHFQLRFPVLVDQEEKTHPLSGILRAMEHCSESLFLILPCDTPYLTSASLSHFKKCRTPAIAIHTHRHPLIGLYATTDKERAQKMLSADRSMKFYSKDFHGVFFPQEELHNCNRPEDL